MIPGTSQVDSATATAAAQAAFIQAALPSTGLFARQRWRIAPAPFRLDQQTVDELATLGRILLRFNQAANLLYRQSLAGKQPAWVAAWLDQGKPEWLLQLQRCPALKHAVPRVIRPDLILTDTGLALTELDSVPGGIGLTAWLNQTYAALPIVSGPAAPRQAGFEVIGGPEGMLVGFAGIFGDAPRVRIVVSEEAATYRPEMEWMATRLGAGRFSVEDATFMAFGPGDAVYRFFELFDVANVPNARCLFQMSERREILLTPPAKPLFEEKLLLALLWNGQLREFWRQQLGEGYFRRLLSMTPYTWVLDPAPLPPQGVIPELELTGWQELKRLSQRQRQLILKVSGFSELAWGARSVVAGNDVAQADWAAAVEHSLQSFPRSPYVLQRYHKPRLVEVEWFDFALGSLVKMTGRARLCPYYFVHGDGDAAEARLGGVLATVCPADKKIIHGMDDAVLAPCCV